MDKKRPLTETAGNIKEALSNYAGRMIGDEIGAKIKRYVREAVLEALAEGGGDSVKLDPRETVVNQHSQAYNPAINERAKKMVEESELAKAGYVDEKAAARKAFYKQKNGG